MCQRDHIEIEPENVFAGVTDRGLRHKENQDDMALAVVKTASGSHYIAVVCDGVSGSERAASASAAAAETACEALVHGLTDAPDQDIKTLVTAAIAEANVAVCSLTYTHGTAKEPPETTIVAAVVTGCTAVIGWVGDSRAYWFTADDAAILTRDHSWVNDVVDAGLMSETLALKSRMARAIVRCLGGEKPDSKEHTEASVIRCNLPEGARLLLCSDGLWCYASTLETLENLVRAGSGDSPLAVAQHLVQFAIGRGGRDNITAIILEI